MAFDLDGLLKLAIERRASDLHLKVGAPPVLRIDHQLVPAENRPCVTQADIDTTVCLVATELQRQRFAQHRELDVSYGVAGLGRFRTNLFQQRGMVGVIFRIIPLKIETIEELNLPRSSQNWRWSPGGWYWSPGPQEAENRPPWQR